MPMKNDGIRDKTCFNLKKINRTIVFKSQCILVFIGSV